MRTMSLLLLWFHSIFKDFFTYFCCIILIQNNNKKIDKNLNKKEKKRETTGGFKVDTIPPTYVPTLENKLENVKCPYMIVDREKCVVRKKMRLLMSRQTF